MRLWTTAILGTLALASLRCSDGSTQIKPPTGGSAGSGGSTGGGSPTAGSSGSGGSGGSTGGTSNAGGSGGSSGSSSGDGGSSSGDGGSSAGSDSSGSAGTGGSGGAGTGGSGGSASVDAGNTGGSAGSGSKPEAGAPDTGGGGGGTATGKGPFKILVMSTTLEYAHPSIGTCLTMLKALGKSSAADLAAAGAAADSTWSVDSMGTDPKAANYFSEITAANLKNYELVYSNNPTGTVFTSAPGGEDKKKIFQDYYDNGGSWAGQHSATDFEKTSKWSWFQDNVDGGWFDTHDDNPSLAGTVAWESAFVDHPILKGLTSPWNVNDEWYIMNRNIEAVPGFKVLAKVTVPTSSKNKNPRPAIWIKENAKGGRSFYTIRGHGDATYAEPEFRALMLRGILWATHRI